MHIADSWFRGGEGSDVHRRNHGQPVCEKWLARNDAEERRPWRYGSKCSHGQEDVYRELREDGWKVRPLRPSEEGRLRARRSAETSRLCRPKSPGQGDL